MLNQVILEFGFEKRSVPERVKFTFNVITDSSLSPLTFSVVGVSDLTSNPQPMMLDITVDSCPRIKEKHSLHIIDFSVWLGAIRGPTGG